MKFVHVLVIVFFLFLGASFVSVQADTLSVGGVFSPSFGEVSSLVSFSTSSGFFGAQFDLIIGPETISYLPFLVVQVPLKFFEIATLIPYVGAAPYVTLSGTPTNDFGVKMGQMAIIYNFGISMDLLFSFPSLVSTFSSGVTVRF